MPAKDRTLAVDLGGVTLPTPAMIAAGCAGGGRELAGLVDLHRVGGLVSRTITVHPRPGASTPRIAESPSGVVWNTGLQNAGIDAFAAECLGTLKKVHAIYTDSMGDAPALAVDGNLVFKIGRAHV